MENKVEKFPILRLTKEGRGRIEEVVAREFPVTLILNDQELVTLLCSPTDLRYLAVGFLSSEGLLKSKDEIKKIMVDNERGVVRLETVEDKEFAQDILFKRIISSGCGRGASFYSAADAASPKVESQMEISTDEVFALVNEFQHGSELYLATHGVHSAALCDRKSILVFSEDIGRHNAIDKIFGKCLLEDMPTNDRVVITSGRISSEILHKVAKRDIPIIISISAPTNLGVRIADSLGITLIGSVRGKKMNVYMNDWRIVRDGK
ncbi:MAG: formate dehydrogenase family accessory protein FdhD [Chloroflexi bacterium CG07_land_8_20_14_0_80_51_10]|nr:MAG: formate dehydrogenase family accessory protein FdhD [Chloroflexi bacterium CG07_land_8_20_14_0_80_51_10]